MIKVKLKENNLQKIRLYRDMTQEELAKKSNVSKRLIYAIERTDYCPSFTKRMLISNALGFDQKNIFVLKEED